MHAFPVLPMCARLYVLNDHLCHGHIHSSKQQPWNSVCCKLITSDAKSASAGKAAAVQAEFAKAGISAEVTQKVLKLQAVPELGCGDQAATCPAVMAARAGH